MVLTLILAVQAAATPATPAAGPRWAVVAPAGAIDFDLARYSARQDESCPGAVAGEVLVCARRRGGSGAYPLDYWAAVFADRPIRAEMDLGGNVQGRIHAEAVAMDRGAVSNRVMVGIRMPF